MAAVLKKRALAEYSQTIQEPTSGIPTKRLRLVKKQISTSGKNFLTLVNHLEECKTSNEVLNLLLQISDTDLDASDISEAVKKLGDHFKNEKESSVRVKILSLLYEIGVENNSEVVAVIDETILLLKNDNSHKVIAQGMNTILKLGKLVADVATAFHVKLVEVAKLYLKDTSHAVKCKCLEIIGVHSPLTTDENTETLVHLIRSYFNHDDARVRCQAFSTIVCLHERNFKINPNIYIDVSNALKDDYEIVRHVVLKLIWLLGNTYPENEIFVPGSEHEIRLIDDAFGKICNGVTDLSMNVRTLAAQLLVAYYIKEMYHQNQVPNGGLYNVPQIYTQPQQPPVISPPFYGFPSSQQTTNQYIPPTPFPNNNHQYNQNLPAPQMDQPNTSNASQYILSGEELVMENSSDEDDETIENVHDWQTVKKITKKRKANPKDDNTTTMQVSTNNRFEPLENLTDNNNTPVTPKPAKILFQDFSGQQSTKSE